jgi:hypothetical protein
LNLFSAAKVGKISETDVSLPEKVVSNQEKYKNVCQVPVPFYVAFQIIGSFLFLINAVNQLLTLL